MFRWRRKSSYDTSRNFRPPALAWAKKDALKNTTSMSIGENIIPAILWGPVAAKKDKVKKTVVKDAFQNLELIQIQTSLPKEKCTE
jgi:hypothetical protein